MPVSNSPPCVAVSSRASRIKPRCSVRRTIRAKRFELTALRVSSGQDCSDPRGAAENEIDWSRLLSHPAMVARRESPDAQKRAALTGGRAALCRWLPDPSNDLRTCAARWRRGGCTDRKRGPLPVQAWAAALTAGSPAMRACGGYKPMHGPVSGKVSKVRSQG